MKNTIIFGLSLLFIIGLATAQPILDYTLIGDKALVEIDFGEVENLEYKLPYDARTIESNSDFEVVNGVLKVGQSDSLIISYISESLVEKSNKRNYFVFNNHFNESIVLTVRLPEGGILEEGGIMFPNPDEIVTDGRIIILRWNDLISEEVVVAYETVKHSNTFLIVLVSLLLVGVVVYQTVSLKRRIKKLKEKKKVSKKTQKAKTKKAITRNLFGEEKKIVEYLLERKKNESWTKEIVKDLDISKVRLSRRLRNLQQKGLVQKTPYGNENRIKLVKKV